jgi:hypothetical protein
VSISTSGWGEERTCVLVLIGATKDGTKELLTVADGSLGAVKSPRRLSWPRSLRQDWVLSLQLG